MKPNLWLLVNPNIACPIQYRETTDLQNLCEPAEEVQTALLDPVDPQHQMTTELHALDAPHDASLQGELLHSVSSSSEYMVQFTLQTVTLLPASVNTHSQFKVFNSSERFSLTL